MSVSDNFTGFCDNLRIPISTRSTISNRYELITQRLNYDFWNIDSKTYHSRFIGSYGRGTAIDGFSDLDMIFQLPYEVYKRIDEHYGNGQSVLLQEVKNSIKKTYPSTSIGGDGQVVVVPFSDNITFEVMPAFVNKDDSYTYPDSNGGGSWKITNPIPELNAINTLDKDCSGNLMNLCKMTRAWKRYRDVPIGGLLIDTLAYNFIKTYEYRNSTKVYYDYMCRDFLKYLMEQNTEQQYWYAVGSNQKIYRRGLFEYKAKVCYNISLEAIEAESNSYTYTAKSKWREIYGSYFPN